jgi:hypothetical protein
MNRFSQRSKDVLSNADARLQRLFNEVLKVHDCAIMESYRDKATQNKYFAEGKSDLPWPKGKHCKLPSEAVDVLPFINGKPCFGKEENIFFAGIVAGIAYGMGIKIRWGGDWDSDRDQRDQKLNDYVHYEV